jgi:integrase
MKTHGARSWGYLKTYKSSKGNRYYAYVLDDNNKYHSIGVFSNKEQAEAKLDSTQLAIKADMWTPTPTRKDKQQAKLTFSEYAVNMTFEQELRATSRRQYQMTLNNHLIPFFKNKPLSKITRQDCQEFYKQLDKTKTFMVNHCMRRLKSVLYQAILDGIISENPAKGIKYKLPRKTTKTAISKALLEKDEIITLINATPPKYRLIVVLGAYCGLRIGEILALTANDIDMNKHNVSISKSVNHRNGKAHFSEPKTQSSIRIVHIPSEAVAYFEDHIQNYAGKHYLFERQDKQPMARSKWNDKYFSKIRKTINRPDFRFHDLRHTCLTYYARQGATIKDLMQIAGHSSPDIAMIYQETSNDHLEQLANKLSFG